ncbi:UNKNOWN [Stylonychia lemnae]|uniref:Uncharacterized protein n=1 Tax=Stylonychia lemnae TaxID=5949 RepID=A0A078B3R5_STYLE|nr:UNKNOWN [Stylonychia lemnae]|eukprot:CDW87862.1 UNKNOWN [Stylonychia lemnae]
MPECQLNSKDSGTDLRKQWLGYFLIGTTLDTKHCLVKDINTINKQLNTYLAQITNTINKSELGVGNDMIGVAIKAWTVLTTIIYQHYDQKAHATALQAIKQIVQVLMKKIDKSVKLIADKQFKVDQDDIIQVRMAIKSILSCVQMFPSSLKNIVSSKGNNAQKDHITVLIENLVKQTMQNDTVIADYCLQLLCLLFKSKEKSKLQFRDWVSRILQNLVIYVNSLQPRQFEDVQGANQEINMNIAFEFLFEREDASQINKLSVKDLKDQISNIGKVQMKMQMLFRMLDYTFQVQRRTQQYSSEGVNFMQVEVNINEIILTLGKNIFILKCFIESIMTRQTGQVKSQKQKSNQICGLQHHQFDDIIEQTKVLGLNFLKVLTKQIDIESYLEVLDILQHLHSIYGANLASIIKEVAFGENEMNLSDLICDLFMLVKANKFIKHDHISKKLFSLGDYDSYTLQQFLQHFLIFLINLTSKSTTFGLFSDTDRVKLESVLFTILSFSQLKYFNMTKEIKLKVLELTKNVIISRSVKLQQNNDLLGCLISYRNNAMHFQGEDTDIIAKIHEVISVIDPLIAPRKDKYTLQTNTQQYFQNEHKSMFIEYNKELLRHYLLPNNESQQDIQAQENLIIQQQVPQIQQHMVTKQNASDLNQKQKITQVEENIQSDDDEIDKIPVKKQSIIKQSNIQSEVAQKQQENLAYGSESDAEQDNELGLDLPMIVGDEEDSDQ